MKQKARDRKYQAQKRAMIKDYKHWRRKGFPGGRCIDMLIAYYSKLDGGKYTYNSVRDIIFG